MEGCGGGVDEEGFVEGDSLFVGAVHHQVLAVEGSCKIEKAAAGHGQPEGSSPVEEAKGEEAVVTAGVPAVDLAAEVEAADLAGCGAEPGAALQMRGDDLAFAAATATKPSRARGQERDVHRICLSSFRDYCA